MNKQNTHNKINKYRRKIARPLRIKIQKKKKKKRNEKRIEK